MTAYRKNDPGKIDHGSPDHAGSLFTVIGHRVYAFLSSVRLALALLIAILACCVFGAAVLPYEESRRLIFSTIWFNGLLVLLTVNVAFCFFPRMRGRKLTAVSLGMIVFHLSFVAILLGIIYNSLFYFRGSIRLTEGESLPSGRRASYDTVQTGPFFSYSWLRGNTTLLKLYAKYIVGGADKQGTYEIEVGEGRAKKKGVVYITNSLSNNGFSYYNDREGYSVLLIVYDRQGKELYGAHIPLQSLKQKDDSYLYTTGTKVDAGNIPVPFDEGKALFRAQIVYHPNPAMERTGDIDFKVWSLSKNPIGEKTVPVGKKARFGDYFLEVREIRYWAAMNVLFEPGKPIVLASLCAGLAGMVITTVGRMRKRQA